MWVAPRESSRPTKAFLRFCGIFFGKILQYQPIYRRRDLSELKQAIVPPVRWSGIVWLLTMLVIVALGTCIVLLGDNWTAISILLGLLGIVYMFCLIWLQYRCVHAYYVNGILYRRFFGDMPVLFEDIEAYSLIPIKKTSLRDKAMGKPDTYQYRIIFYLKNEYPLNKITILFPENDYRLESFFAELQIAIFRRLYAHYQKEKWFVWTPGVRVVEQGVELTGDPKNAFARDVFIPFGDLDGGKFCLTSSCLAEYKNSFWRTIEVLLIIFSPSSILTGTVRTGAKENKVLHIFQAGSREPDIAISCTSPNFHPGYDAFRKIVWEKRGMDMNLTHTDWISCG